MAKRKPPNQFEDPADVALTNQQLRQPDFGRDFHQDSTAPICYETSFGRFGNVRYDFARISSYIHDATFQMNKVQRRGKSIVIPLDRARNELDNGHGEIAHIRSQLTISPVIALVWHLHERNALDPKFYSAPEVTIYGLFFREPVWDFSEPKEDEIQDFILHLTGYGFELQLRVRPWRFRVCLTDSVV